MTALLITGGSRGIGAACCRLAAQAGWRVGVNYAARADAAEAVVAEIEAAGGQAIALPGDVADAGDVRAMYDRLEAAFGPVAGVISNAGILGPMARLTEIGPERWARIQAVNATGTYLVAREAVRRMIDAGTRGSIVIMSSMAAPLGAPGEFIDYAASKGAVESLTIGLAKEVAASGIRVNAIRPGLIETDIQGDTGDALRAQRLAATVPMGRAGRAEEVAEAAIWLLSEKASYVTGALLPVSGGR